MPITLEEIDAILAVPDSEVNYLPTDAYGYKVEEHLFR
jgi:hypothetical protein